MLHYVYNLIDPRNGDVFYVGKGVGRRVYWHQPPAFRGGHCNPKLQNKIRKIRSLGFQIPVEKIFQHEEEWPCHVIEVMAIAFYGRGNLCNLTDGSEGISGYQHSEQAKLKKSSYRRKRFLGTLVALIVMCCVNARAYVLVEDVPALTNNSINEVKNYALYLQQTANSATSITNQITQIENQVTALQRFGNPQYYVNMLGLSSFMNTASVLTSGIGNTLSAYRQAANGLQALGYTGNGLYSNLTGSLDRYGNPVQYQTDAFRKFAAVNDMVEGYNTQQRTFNAQMASLQQQLTTAMANLNAASTQMETEKYAAQVNAIHAQMNALTQTTNLTGQRAAVQQLSNQNDAARVQEASRQEEIQERQEDLQNEATGFSRLIGGAQ